MSSAGVNGTPSWLAEQGGHLLIQRLVELCAPLGAELIFAVRAEDIRRFRLNNVIRMAAPGSQIVSVGGQTQGAACTALLCIRHIDAEDELLVLNSNEVVLTDYKAAIDDFRIRGLDGGVIVFPSLHPRYSYLRLDEAGMVREAAEKNPISPWACAGFFWFRRGGEFIEAVKAMIRKDAHVDEQFYINPVLNELLLKRKRLGVVEVPSSHYIPLKSSAQISAYSGSREALQASA